MSRRGRGLERKEVQKMMEHTITPTLGELQRAVSAALKTNGGPISGDNGDDYVMVRRDAFDRLAALVKVAS